MKLNPHGVRNIAILIILACIESCQSPREEHHDSGIDLELYHVASNNVQLKISIPDTSTSWDYSINRGDSIISHSTVYQSDTTITDKDLTPDSDYQYRAYYWENGEITDSSEILQVQTLDTTSYSLTWIVDTFGIYGTEIFDVAILAEDDIRAVGRIWFEDPDSSYMGTGVEYYNLAKFNGTAWEFHRVGDEYPGITYAICVINENDIWYSIEGNAVHWNGLEYSIYHPNNSPGIPQGTEVYRIWANAPDDIFFVGYGGSFFHYDGQSFETIETSTYISLVDIIGTPGSDDIFIRGYKNPGGDDPPGCCILHFKPSTGELQRLYYAEYPNTQGEYGWTLGFGVGKQSNILLASTSEGLLEINTATGTRFLTPTSVCKFGRSAFPDGPGQVRNIFYNAPNDIFFVGIGLKNVHFNGYSYNLQLDVDTAFPEIRVEKSRQHENLYVVAGYQYDWGYGAIARIWKN